MKTLILILLMIVLRSQGDCEVDNPYTLDHAIMSDNPEFYKLSSKDQETVRFIYLNRSYNKY